MSIWGKVTGKRKTFMKLLCDRVPPYEACRKVWPHIKDVHAHVTHISNDAEFRRVYAILTDYQSSREQLIVECLRIVESKDVANDDRLAAIKAVATLKGYIKSGSAVLVRGSTKPRVLPLEENQLLEKMAELGRKAYKDKGAN